MCAASAGMARLPAKSPTRRHDAILSVHALHVSERLVGSEKARVLAGGVLCRDELAKARILPKRLLLQGETQIEAVFPERAVRDARGAEVAVVELEPGALLYLRDQRRVRLSKRVRVFVAALGVGDHRVDVGVVCEALVAGVFTSSEQREKMGARSGELERGLVGAGGAPCCRGECPRCRPSPARAARCR